MKNLLRVSIGSKYLIFYHLNIFYSIPFCLIMSLEEMSREKSTFDGGTSSSMVDMYPILHLYITFSYRFMNKMTLIRVIVCFTDNQESRGKRVIRA